MSITLGTFTNVQAFNLGGDVFELTALDANGNAVTATGWVSHTTNYYPPASYQANGSLVPGVTPRAMTQAERRAYAFSLLQAAGASAQVQPAGTPIANF